MREKKNLRIFYAEIIGYFYVFVLGAIVSTRLKSRELIAPLIKPLLLLLYGKTMPLPAPAAMLSAAAAFLPAIYLTCAH